MENRKRIRKTIRLVLKETKRERLQKRRFEKSQYDLQRKDENQ